MITHVELVNDPTYLVGMRFSVQTKTVKGNPYTVDAFVGKSVRNDLSYPYNEITWTNKYLVSCYGVDDDLFAEFDNLEDAVKMMDEHKVDHRCDIAQVRILNNGSRDTCTVTYN